LDTDEHKAAKLETLKRNLSLAGELGAASLFTPEYRAQVPLPLWQAKRPIDEKGRVLLLDLLNKAAVFAEEVNGRIALEPLNRYETPHIHTVADALDICRRVRNSRAGILADFFHMNIEEEDITSALRMAEGRILHVQLGDSNRLLPGQGHLDFRPGLAELIRQQYSGFLSLECRTNGTPEQDVPRCAQYLQQLLEECSNAGLSQTS
jgi:sugar phosphate isomerase/epimerase